MRLAHQRPHGRGAPQTPHACDGKVHAFIVCLRPRRVPARYARAASRVPKNFLSPETWAGRLTRAKAASSALFVPSKWLEVPGERSNGKGKTRFAGRCRLPHGAWMYGYERFLRGP